MRERMRNLFTIIAMGTVLIFLSQGCSTPTAMRRGGTASGGAKQPRSELTAQIAQKRLNVSVVGKTKDKESNISASRIRNMVEESLVDAGYLVNKKLPDLVVGLNVETDLWDRTGPYYVYKGACSASVKRHYDGKLVGRRRFSARGKRIQDKGDAIVSLAEKLGAEASDWVVETSAPAKVGVAAVDLVIEHSWYNFFKKQPEYVDTFIQALEKVDGIISCRLATEDHDGKRRVFHVVYVEDKIPEGLLNRIASIEELDIKPAH